MSSVMPGSRLSYLDNIIASYIVYYCQAINIKPNLITSTSLIVGLIAGVALFYFKSPFLFSFFIILAYTLDNVDGIWARTKNQVSTFGAYIDKYFDYVKEYFFDIVLLLYSISQAKSVGLILPLYFYLFYFSIKGLYYLSVDQEKKAKISKELKFITFGPAEKYIIVFPILAFVPALIMPFFLLMFFMYLFLIINNIKNKKQIV